MDPEKCERCARQREHDAKYAHHAHSALDDLIEDRDAAQDSADSLRADLVRIADKLGVEPDDSKVNQAIDDLKAEVLRLNEARKKDGEAAAKLAASLLNQADHIQALEQQIEEMAPAAKIGAVDGALGSVLTLLALGVNNSPAKNFVEIKMDWDEGALKVPFAKAAVTFYRAGGKSPADLLKEAQDARDELGELAREIVDEYVSPRDERHYYAEINRLEAKGSTTFAPTGQE